VIYRFVTSLDPNSSRSPEAKNLQGGSLLPPASEALFSWANWQVSPGDHIITRSINPYGPYSNNSGKLRMTHRSLRVTFWFLNFESFFGVSKYLPTIFVDASKPHMFDASLMLQSPIAPKMGYPQIIQVVDDHFDIETHRDLGILYLKKPPSYLLQRIGLACTCPQGRTCMAPRSSIIQMDEVLQLRT
jgi:hypothetical protein